MANSYRSMLSVVLGDIEYKVFESLTASNLELRLTDEDWNLWQDSFLDLRLGNYQLQLAHMPELDNVVYLDGEELFSCSAGDTAFFYGDDLDEQVSSVDWGGLKVDSFGKLQF